MKRSSQSKLPQVALETTKVDWSQWDPWAGLQGLIGIAIPLTLGFFLGNPSAGAIASGGALYIGLGSFDKRTRTSTASMLLGSFIMGLAALAGSLAGGHLWTIVPLAGLWAFGAGLLAVLGPPLSFIGLKSLVTVLIAGGYPSSTEDAFIRSGLILAGALLQTFLFFAEDSYLARFGAPRRLVTPQPLWKKSWASLKFHLNLKADIFQHAIRLTLCILISQAVCRILLSHNTYWLPLTVAIVMRPDFEQTLNRGFARMAGTIIGAGLTTLIVMWLKPSGIELALLTLPCAWLCFSLFRASYTLYSIYITAYIVFMLSFIGLPEMSVLINRLIATFAGGSFSLLVYAVWPRRKAAP
jgi:hypothetical protein